jgi:hypothetical protein
VIDQVPNSRIGGMRLVRAPVAVSTALPLSTLKRRFTDSSSRRCGRAVVGALLPDRCPPSRVSSPATMAGRSQHLLGGGQQPLQVPAMGTLLDVADDPLAHHGLEVAVPVLEHPGELVTPGGPLAGDQEGTEAGQ